MEDIITALGPWVEFHQELIKSNREMGVETASLTVYVGESEYAALRSEEPPGFWSCSYQHATGYIEVVRQPKITVSVDLERLIGVANANLLLEK